MSRLAALLAVLCVVVIGAVALAVGSSSAKTPRPPTLASNKAAARADAAKLQTEVTLPVTAKKLSTEPTGDHGYLKPEPHLTANPGFVDTSWWEVNSFTPDQVIQMVQASPPSSVATTGTGSGGNTRTGTSSTDLTFFLQNVTGRLESRLIEVTATALSSGVTGVMVQTQSQWVVPRTAASLIAPDAIRVISVSEATAGGRVLRSVSVTAASRVRGAVAYFNGLEAGQPGTTSCPSESAGGDVVTVHFLSRAGAVPFATATFSGDFGHRLSGFSSECNEVYLHVGTHTEVRLLGGKYIASLNKLLGARIPN